MQIGNPAGFSSSKRTFSQPFKQKCMSEVVRIGSIIIFYLSKLWKARFFILCDILFLVRLQEKLEVDHSWEWKGLCLVVQHLHWKSCIYTSAFSDRLTIFNKWYSDSYFLYSVLILGLLATFRQARTPSLCTVQQRGHSGNLEGQSCWGEGTWLNSIESLKANSYSFVNCHF